MSDKPSVGIKDQDIPHEMRHVGHVGVAGIDSWFVKRFWLRLPHQVLVEHPLVRRSRCTLDLVPGLSPPGSTLRASAPASEFNGRAWLQYAGDTFLA